MTTYGSNRAALLCSLLTGLCLAACNGGRENDSSASSGSLGGASDTDDSASDAASDSDADSDDDEDSDSNSDSDAASTGEEDDTAESDSLSGSSSGGEETNGDSDDAVCDQAEFSFVFEPQTPNVMLVLDKSRSMSQLWDHDGNPITPEISRYNSLYNVVQYLVGALDTEVNFGAQLFPSASAFLDEPQNQNSCLVEGQPEVSVGAGTGASILAAMPDADDFSISGGTPAIAGITSALEHLTNLADDGSKAIVLVTDGAANCNENETADTTLFAYDARVPELVGDVFADHSIPVYVVGINILDEMGTKPAVNPYEAITDVAMAGGAPSPGPEPFYNAFNELELADALDEVITDIECTINLDVEPDSPDSVALIVDAVGYDQVTNCETENGWVYTAPAGPYNAIQLCGAACDSIQDGGLVEVDYICPS